MYMMSWLAVPVLVALFCLVRAVLDLRAKRYVWAVLSLVGAGALLAMPVPTHSVLVDLPAAPPTSAPTSPPTSPLTSPLTSLPSGAH